MQRPERSQPIRGATSAPTTRVLDIVELLARPGNEQLRFSDVVRELGLTQATAHGILMTLTDRGWITRDPLTKSFALGPGLAVVAARLPAARPQVEAATAMARQMCAEFGHPASVVERTGDTLLITAFESAERGGRVRRAIASPTARRSVSHSRHGNPTPGSGPGSTAARAPTPTWPPGCATSWHGRAGADSTWTGRRRH